MSADVAEVWGWAFSAALLGLSVSVLLWACRRTPTEREAIPWRELAAAMLLTLFCAVVVQLFPMAFRALF